LLFVEPRDAYNNNRPNAEDNVTQPLHLPVPNYMNGEQQQNIAGKRQVNVSNLSVVLWHTIGASTIG